MDNEQLILKQLLNIREDIGGLNSTQESLDGRMDCLDKSMEMLEKSCSDTTVIQINKKQLVLAVGAIVTGVGGIGIL